MIQRLPGRRSRYRGKVRRKPISIILTPAGWAWLETALAATGLSRSDYLEMLIRADGPRRQRRADTHSRPSTEMPS